MIYSKLFLVAAAFTGFASAVTNFTACCDVDPTTVDSPTRAAWCRAQMNTCPELCPNGNAAVNKCDNEALTYECSCGGGNTPNVSDYMQTLPSLECDEWKTQCTAAHPNDLAGQTFCQSYICGSKNGSLTVASSTSSGSSGASSASPSASGSASGTSAPSASATVSEGTTSRVMVGLLVVAAMFTFASLDVYS